MFRHSFVCDSMMQIVLVTLFLVVTECQMKIAENAKDILEYRKPNTNFNEKHSTDRKQRKVVTKNDSPLFRNNEIKLRKKYDGTSKWPKIQRTITTKSKPRITRMNMMQKREDTTIHDEPLEYTDESNEYLSSYSIRQQLENISKKIPHSNVTVEVIGRTMEYQDIVLLKITKKYERHNYFRADDDKYADETSEKKIIFIVHGLSVMGVKKLRCLSWKRQFLKLVSYYVNHLDKFDIFLIPMGNPDGYAMINQNRHVWNKNAALQSECPGVALDRNFDVAWSSNRSINSCSQEYPGLVPFSEAESRAVRDIFHKYSHKIVAYLNVHAGTYDINTFKGDAVLYPKGYTDSVADDDKYIDLKGEIDEAIRNASFQVYSVAVDTLYNWYGKVTGTSVDYASTVYGIPFALELVMQLYGIEDNPELTAHYVDNALTDAWSTVIDVTIKYIWKELNKGNEVR